MKTSKRFYSYAQVMLILSIPLLMAQCLAPINSSFESARMLEKGDVEITGGYARYTSYEGEGGEPLNYNLTTRAGVGISKRFDLKMRYTRLNGTEDGVGSNYIHLAPKFGIIPDYFAFTLPVGVYFADGTTWVTSPKLLGTYPHKSNKFDATLGFKSDIFFEDGEVLLGFTAGMGFSSDLGKWALRPEVGYMINPGETGHFLNWGIGLVYTFQNK